MAWPRVALAIAALALPATVLAPSALKAASPEAIEEQVERLEVHHLASPDGDLHFALLSDWVDADTEELDTDRALLEAAARGVERLNLRYPPSSAWLTRWHSSITTRSTCPTFWALLLMD
jgi:hypothetical protein